MKGKLKKDLKKLAAEILTEDDLGDISKLYDVSRKLYEKLAVLRFIEEELNDLEVDVSKNAIAAKFEEMASAVLKENKNVPESNPHKEDIITPGMDTIKGMVSEMPNTEELENVLDAFMSNSLYQKNDMEEVTPLQKGLATTQEKTASLNDRLAKSNIQVDLNNRLAFVKHLFNDKIEDYNRVLSQLNTIDSEERSLSFIEHMVKPEYNHWEGKEEYEERFIALIARRFI